MFPSGQVDSHADQKLLNMATLEAAAVSRDQRTCLGLATHPWVSPSPLLPLLRSGSRSAAQIRRTQCTKDSAAIRIPHIWYNEPQATFLPLVCSQAERFPAGLSPALPCRSRTCRAIVCIPVPPVVPMPLLQLEVISLGSSGPSKPCSEPSRSSRRPRSFRRTHKRCSTTTTTTRGHGRGGRVWHKEQPSPKPGT